MSESKQFKIAMQTDCMTQTDSSGSEVCVTREGLRLVIQDRAIYYISDVSSTTQWRVTLNAHAQ